MTEMTKMMFYKNIYFFISTDPFKTTIFAIGIAHEASLLFTYY